MSKDSDQHKGRKSEEPMKDKLRREGQNDEVEEVEREAKEKRIEGVFMKSL